MRRHAHRTKLIDEVGAVDALVAAEPDRPRPVGMRPDHVTRRHPLGVPVGFGQAGIDEKAERSSIRLWATKHSLAALPGPFL
jgi:hypothetical protein